MDIKSLLETDIEEKHVQNFIYYSMIFIVLFVINFYVYFTYFRETFFRINILKSIVLVISLSFPVYFLNFSLYFMLEKIYIKVFQKRKLEKENILKKIDNYNKKINKLEKLVGNNKEIIKEYQLHHEDSFYLQHKRAEKKLLSMRNEALAFELKHINIKETFNDYKNKINNRFKRSISVGGLGYFVSIIISLFYLSKTFKGFLTKFITLNSFIIMITISGIMFMYFYGKFKKYKDKFSLKISIILLLLILIPLITPLFLIPKIQIVESYVYNFINGIL